MTTPTDERRDLLTVVATMRARAGKEEELREALEALVEPTSHEAGYVNYDLHQNLEDPAEFAFYENWESPDHLDAHLAAPHLVEFVEKIPDLLDGPLVVRRMRRIA
ncbi:Quinol monooxygenase YgiN [Quadrisphaera granulorum]|uniref:Quinol monooxygenase YgiN n=1 Tax=Quadrisphaera granulorum TaxID=317664 RepID=A0A316A6H3_9ACTN|nr:putative quinol monooxygenase [Quadrisphaera granulorum]PWJ53526.1 quinol monooxygenase YgiN [Quadrisphaera granulorum]SZE96868.1 Quinol monooxygenase YgiN [Quadrisphaera granulorum]